jgi:hypothetical protein
MLRGTSVSGAPPVTSGAPAPGNDDLSHARADPIRHLNSSLTHEVCGGCELDSTTRELTALAAYRARGADRPRSAWL